MSYFGLCISFQINVVDQLLDLFKKSELDKVTENASEKNSIPG